MNRKEVVITVANLTGFPKELVKEVLKIAGQVVSETLSQDEDVVIVPGFGKFKSEIRLVPKIWMPTGIGEIKCEYLRLRAARFYPDILFQKRVKGDL